MRTILHLGRTFCEWMAALYLAHRIEVTPVETVQRFLKSVFYTSIVLAISTVLEKVFRIDFYHFFTGGRALLIDFRPRGFDYEPRGLSQNLAYAALLTPFTAIKDWKYVLIPIFLMVGFYVTISFTGLAVLAAGMLILSLILIFRNRDLLNANRRIFLVAALLMIILLPVGYLNLSHTSQVHLSERFGYFFKSNFAEKLEVFDAASINFLNHNPKYYALGTGPGLIYLPAGNYVLERDNYIWHNRFEALPHMGVVLILANSGVLGLLFFLYIIWTGARLKRHDQMILFTLGVLLAGIFMVQMRYYFIFGLACLLALPKAKTELGAPEST